VIRQLKRDDTILSTDTIKPRSAIFLCMRLFLVSDLVALNACFPDSHDDIRAELRQAIEATTQYIAENSLTPLTSSQSRRMTGLSAVELLTLVGQCFVGNDPPILPKGGAGHHGK
jgi:hypothetical protein